MKRFAFIALVCLFAALGARSQVTVSGNVKDAGVANVTGSNAYVRFTLTGFGGNIPRVTGTNVIAVPYKDFKPDVNGNISGSLQGNDTISIGANPVGGTWYQVCIFYQGTQFRCAPYTINGSTFNLNSATPNSTTPTVPAPTGDNTYIRKDGGNSPVTGGIAFTNANTHSGPETFNGSLLATAGNTQLTNAGIYDNTGFHFFHQALLNGISPAIENAGVNLTEAWTSGNVVPSTSTVQQADASGSFVNNSSTITAAVAQYSRARSLVNNARVWGGNDNVATLASVTSETGGITGREIDMNIGNVAGITGIAVGVSAINAGAGQATTMPAFQVLSSTGFVPTSAWRTPLLIDGFSDTAITFAGKDTGLQITQAVTLNAAPQSVTTNGVCPTGGGTGSKLFVGTYISVDSGANQEDVQITNAACAASVFSITGVFTKNHGNPTVFTEYAGQGLWNAGNPGNGGVTRGFPYVWGSIQAWNTSNTTGVLQFGVFDAVGTLRSSESFTSTGLHLWKDVGTTGFLWQSQAGVNIASLSDAGDLQLPTPGTATTSVATLGAAQTLTNKTLIGPVLTTPTIGGGTTLTKYSRFSVSLTPAAVAANTCAAQSFTVTGIAAADILIAVSKPTEQAGLSVGLGHVTGANTATINFCNNTAAAITPTAAETYQFVAVQ